MQVTAKAPSNIAMIKYWGKSDSALNWPSNSSLSMTLKNCFTETIASFSDQSSFTLNGKEIDLAEPKHRKIQKHLQRLRDAFQLYDPIVIRSQNSFPTGAGIASSASGMAALTLALYALRHPTETTQQAEKGFWQNPALVDLARLGSGSACRSLAGGFVEWRRGSSLETQEVRPLADHRAWPLFDTIIIVSDHEKSVNSTDGHAEAASSPLFAIRQSGIAERMQRIKAAIEQKDIWTLGWILEEEASEMHAVMLSQRQPLQYFSEQSVYWIQKVRQYRLDTAFPVFWTLDAGSNVHIIGELKHRQGLSHFLQSCQSSVQLLEDEAGPGPHVQIE